MLTDIKNRTINPQNMANWEAFVQQVSNTQTLDIPLLFLGGDDKTKREAFVLSGVVDSLSALTAWDAFVQQVTRGLTTLPAGQAGYDCF